MCLLHDLTLDLVKPLPRQIIMRMPLKPESQQMPQLFPVAIVHHGACRFHIILIGSREQGIGVFLELFRAGHELGPGKVEKGIAVVEERSWGNDLVRGVVDQEAEVAEVPVGVVDDGIEHDHIPQGLEVFRAHFLIKRLHGSEAAVGHQASHGHEGNIPADEKLAGRAKLALPLGQAVVNGVDAHGLGHLGGIIFGIGLEASVGRAGGATLVQLHLAVDPAPALGQHAVGGQLRGGNQRGADAAAVAGERDQAQDAAEPVFIQIVLIERPGKAVLHDPIAVVQGKPLANGDDGHGPVDAQSATSQQRAHIGAVLGDGALLYPAAQALRRQGEVHGKLSLLFLVDPFDPQLGRCRILNDAEPQQRRIELFQYVAHARTSLPASNLYFTRKQGIWQARRPTIYSANAIVQSNLTCGGCGDERRCKGAVKECIKRAYSTV